MATNEIHVNDVGTNFILTISDENQNVVNLSSATTLNIIFKKPDGSLLTKTATLYTDGTDGKINYATVSGDLDLYGSWSIQAFVIVDSLELYSDIQKFKVYKNLEAC